MKNKKRVINGRAFNAFGYYFHVTLVILEFLSLVVLIGLTGSCELFEITLVDYILRVLPCLVVLGSCVLIQKKVFKED